MWGEIYFLLFLLHARHHHLGWKLFFFCNNFFTTVRNVYTSTTKFTLNYFFPAHFQAHSLGGKINNNMSYAQTYEKVWAKENMFVLHVRWEVLKWCHRPKNVAIFRWKKKPHKRRRRKVIFLDIDIGALYSHIMWWWLNMRWVNVINFDSHILTIFLDHVERAAATHCENCRHDKTIYNQWASFVDFREIFLE